MGGTGAGGARKGTAPLLFVTATVRSRRPTPLPEGNWLAPKLRTLLERLETLSVGPQRRWTWTNQGQSLEVRGDQWADESSATARPHLPGVALVGSNRPSADVLATNELLAIGRTVPTGCAPGRQHFWLTSATSKGQVGVCVWLCSGLFACPLFGPHRPAAITALWHLSGLASIQLVQDKC